MAEQCIRGVVETTVDHDIEIVCAIDADPETARRLRSLRREFPKRVSWVFSVKPNYRGNSRAWNDALALSTGDPVVFAADDLEWQGGWLDVALERLSEFDEGCGLVGFNDGHWDGNSGISTHYLMSRRFIVEVLGGVVAWDFYRHSFNDAEVNARARAAERYAWCEEARVYHSHWLFGDREMDATDTRTLGDHGEAERIFKRRQAEGFPNDGIEPVIYQ